MEPGSLDRLLATLDVQLRSFAVCEVAADQRLVLEPMNVVVVHYVLAGTGLLEVDGAVAAEIGAGSILIVPADRGQALVAGRAASVDVPAADHCAAIVDGLIKFDAAAGEPGKLRTICATLIASYGGSFGLFDSLVHPIVDDVTDIPAVRAAFEQLAQERAAPDIGTHAITGAIMKQCLILLVRRHLRRGSSASPFFAALADARLAKAVAFVLQRPAARLTLAELAGKAGMSRTAFANAFTDAFGQPPMDFVQKSRLHRAAQLLAATERPVKVVAASLGFASRSHFSRAFRRAYGADPSAYRRHHDRNPIELPANSGRSLTDKLSD